MSSTVTDRLNGAAMNLAIKAPVRVATTANIALSGEQTIDGVAVVTGDRVLVKSQTTGSANGIYVADTGTWTRAPDFDGNRDVAKGTSVRVTDGTANAGFSFRVSASNPITIGTTSITWVQDFLASATDLSFTQTGSGAEAQSVSAKLAARLSLRDFLTAAELTGCADGSVDVTQACRDLYTRAAAIVATHGRVAIDFENFVMQVFPGTHIVDPASLFPFTTGSIEIKSAGAKFLITGDITVDAVRMSIFELSNPHTHFNGTIEFTYTGTRNVGGANTATAMYRRGVTAFELLPGVASCSFSGHQIVTDCGIGIWGNNIGGTPTAGARNVKGFHLIATRTGYPLLGDRSPHNVDGSIWADASGRAAKCEDVHDHRVVITEKNCDASESVGYTTQLAASSGGFLYNIDIDYTNTETDTTFNTNTCIVIPLADIVCTIRNIKVKFYVESINAGFVPCPFKLGLGQGATTSNANFKIDGLDVSGMSRSSVAAIKGWIFEFPTGWVTGTHLKRVFLHDYTHFSTGAGVEGMNLAGAESGVRIDNITSNNALQLVGNTVTVISAYEVVAPETVLALDTSWIDFHGGETLTGATFTFTNKNLFAHRVAGNSFTKPRGRTFNQVVATASLLAANADNDGLIVIENGGAGNGNIVFYLGAERFRVDGGAPF